MANKLYEENAIQAIANAIRVLNGENDTYTPAEMATAILDAIPTETASGNPINIDDAAAYPAEECVTTLEPVQDLHGYDKPWAGGGGKNVLPMTLDNLKSINAAGTWSNNDYILNGITYTVNVDGGGNVVSINTNGTASAYSLFRLVDSYTASEQMWLTGAPASSSWSGWKIQAEGDETRYDIGSGVTLSSGYNATRIIIVVPQGISPSNVVFKPMLRPYTEASLPFEPYSNICPITGHTGVELKHSGADTSDYDTHSITFPQAQSHVYGGEFDWTNGVLRVTKVNVDLGTLNWRLWEAKVFFSEDNIGAAKTTGITMMCSCYKSVSNVGSISDVTENNVVAGSTTLNRVYITDWSYESASDFKQAMSGVQLVYKLATPIEIPLTPEVITLLKGENNIWTDSGTNEIEYKVDLQSYINKLINANAQNNVSANLLSLNRGTESVEPLSNTEEVDNGYNL